MADVGVCFVVDEDLRFEIAEILVCSILFVKAMDTHTNDVKVLHETFVIKVKGSLAINAKALHETFFVEVTDSNLVWERTQQ